MLTHITFWGNSDQWGFNVKQNVDFYLAFSVVAPVLGKQEPGLLLEIYPTIHFIHQRVYNMAPDWLMALLSANHTPKWKHISTILDIDLEISQSSTPLADKSITLIRV